MFSTLLKKQLYEIFRTYFYNQKTNKKRSKAAVLLFSALLVLLLYGLFGGMMFYIGYLLAPVAAPLGFGWFYYLLFSIIAVLFGTFGSVFNTYSGLYLSKDNDMLLAMPVPPKTLTLARLSGVYLMGLMYSSAITLPAVIMWLAVGEFSVLALIGGVVFIFLVSVVVLILSCLFGYLIARISLKLKNKGIITAIVAIVAIGLYMLVYARAGALVESIVENVRVFGLSVKDKFYPAYFLGRACEGDPIPMLSMIAIVVVLSALTYFIITRSFVKLATANTVGGGKQKAGAQKQRSVFSALMGKEIKRFTSSATYMLNCAFPVVLAPVVAVGLLVKGKDFLLIFGSMMSGDTSLVFVFVAVAIALLASSIGICVPSVSLEGKSLWQTKCLPVDGKTILRAKLALQLAFSLGTSLFTSVCAAIALRADFVQAVVLVIFPLAFCTLGSVFGMYIGVRTANVNWTSEITPIKQSFSVLIYILACWGVAAVCGITAFLLSFVMNYALYLLGLVVIMAALTVVMYKSLMKKGVEAFERL